MASLLVRRAIRLASVWFVGMCVNRSTAVSASDGRETRSRAASGTYGENGKSGEVVDPHGTHLIRPSPPLVARWEPPNVPSLCRRWFARWLRPQSLTDVGPWLWEAWVPTSILPILHMRGITPLR